MTETEFHDGFDKLLDVLGVTSPFFLVVQVRKGFIKLKIYRSDILIGTCKATRTLKKLFDI